jgi:hypothetical protein
MDYSEDKQPEVCAEIGNTDSFAKDALCSLCCLNLGLRCYKIRTKDFLSDLATFGLLHSCCLDY